MGGSSSGHCNGDKRADEAQVGHHFPIGTICIFYSSVMKGFLLGVEFRVRGLKIEAKVNTAILHPIVMKTAPRFSVTSPQDSDCDD
jgi:hypothetical protein